MCTLCAVVRYNNMHSAYTAAVQYAIAFSVMDNPNTYIQLECAQSKLVVGVINRHG